MELNGLFLTLLLISYDSYSYHQQFGMYWAYNILYIYVGAQGPLYYLGVARYWGMQVWRRGDTTVPIDFHFHFALILLYPFLITSGGSPLNKKHRIL